MKEEIRKALTSGDPAPLDAVEQLIDYKLDEQRTEINFKWFLFMVIVVFVLVTLLITK